MKKIYIVLIIVITIILGLVLFGSKPTPVVMETPADNLATITTSATSTTASTTYTIADVATHADTSSCWTVIRGEVYDLTSWVGKHPGGASAILKLCGVDGTAFFTNKHGGMEKQESLLTTFKLGELAE